jgi:nicotinamide mononucleotide transporter PnuC
MVDFVKIMDFFSVENTLFTIGGQGVSFLETFSVTAGLLCVFLATRVKVANFWVGYLYNILLFWLFYQKGLYSSMLLQPVSFIINFYGHYRWTHPRKGEENENRQLRITLLSAVKRLGYIGLMFVFAAIWGLSMKFLPDIAPDLFREPSRPFLDAFVTGAILIAQYLSAQKKLECWAAWFVVNVTNVTLYLLAGMVFLPMVSAAYLVLAIFGSSSWYRQWKMRK